MAYKCRINNNLFYETVRLSTFIDWPHISWLKPITLAEAGFFYLREADYVGCPFCCKSIGDWKQGDSPLIEHEKFSPECPFVRKKEFRNISKYGDTPYVYTSFVENEEWGYPGEIFVTPTKPKFLTVELREESFAKWPESVRQNIHDLAMAGFYYQQLSDHVACYYCNLAIRNWEEEDDPWILHALYSPNCRFMRIMKGKEFIRRQHNDYKKPNASKIKRYFVDLGIPEYVCNYVLRRKYEFIETDLLEALDHMLLFDEEFFNKKNREEEEERKKEEEKENDVTKNIEQQQNDQNMDYQDDSEAAQCEICLKDKQKILLIPCKHMICCSCATENPFLYCQICDSPYSPIYCFLSQQDFTEPVLSIYEDWKREHPYYDTKQQKRMWLRSALYKTQNQLYRDYQQ